jgi:hypothetical protein
MDASAERAARESNSAKAQASASGAGIAARSRSDPGGSEGRRDRPTVADHDRERVARPVLVRCIPPVHRPCGAKPVLCRSTSLERLHSPGDGARGRHPSALGAGVNIGVRPRPRAEARCVADRTDEIGEGWEWAARPFVGAAPPRGKSHRYQWPRTRGSPRPGDHDGQRAVADQVPSAPRTTVTVAATIGEPSPPDPRADPTPSDRVSSTPPWTVAT